MGNGDPWPPGGRVNHEMREVQVAHHSSLKAPPILNDKKARIAYGGRGTISDLQQPRWGTQACALMLFFMRPTQARAVGRGRGQQADL